MNAQVTGDGATAPRSWRERLRSRWYHLGFLVLLISAFYLKPYLDEQAMFLGDGESDLRVVAVSVGPWRLQLQERGEEEPFWSPEEGCYVKALRLAACQPCAREIRAVFVSLKRPGSSEFGVQFEGSPYRSFADMRIVRNAAPGDKVWITAEGWDGTRYQSAMPLAEVSPIKVRWLEDPPAPSRSRGQLTAKAIASIVPPRPPLPPTSFSAAFIKSEAAMYHQPVHPDQCASLR